MHKKQIGAIIAFYALMFTSTFGGTVEELARADVPYDDATAQAFLISFVGICAATILCMAIPAICRLISKKRLPYKRGKLLCLFNSIAVFILSIILQELYGFLFVGWGFAIFFYFINKWTFVRAKEETANDESPTIPDTAEVTLPIDVPAPVQHIATQNNQTATAKARYCSKCGSAIDSKTKKCTGCGKQYFKGIPWKPVCNIAVALLLVASVVGNVLLFKEKTALDKENTLLGDTITELEKSKTVLNTRINQLQDTKRSLQKQNTSLEQDLRIAENEIAFYDQYVVFVDDDGTRLYHNYRCNHRGGDSFWAFNISAANQKGYKPCPYCWG